MPSNFNNTTNNRANNRTNNMGQDFALSTEDFFKNEIFAKRNTNKSSAKQNAFSCPTTLLAGDEAMSTEDFLRKEVFYSDPNNLNQNNSASNNNEAQNTASVRHQPLDYSTEPLQLKLNFDNNKKLIQKFEASITGVKEYEYSFDAEGHLLCAYCDDKLQEQYYYNKLGQRIKAVTTQAKAEYVYNPIGQMVYSAETDYQYDAQGRLVSKKNKNGNTIFQYSPEITTLLTRIVLPNSTCIDYLYAGTTPVLKYLDSVLTEEYLWANPYQLAEWRDHVNKLYYRFEYSDSSPNVAKLAPIALIIGTQRYSLGCDQLGSIKIVQDNNGKLIKNIEYDSFGNVLQDTNPSFVLPLGFAGGLLDKHSNLLHFGYRDYDPKLGRFTCPDPLGDTGGDHDLYDYCIDDPISFSDPSGLFSVRVFNEADHPRAEDGKFTFKSGAGQNKDSATTNAVKDALSKKLKEKGISNFSAGKEAFIKDLKDKIAATPSVKKGAFIKTLKSKVAAITKNDPELAKLGITDDVILSIVEIESTWKPENFNTKNGGNGAQGLMQLRNSVIEQKAENRVKAEWAAKGKPETKLQTKEEQKQLRKEIKTAEEKDVAKIMREGLKLKEGKPKGSKNIKDYEAIPDTGLFNTDTNLQYGVGHLKHWVKQKGSLKNGIKKYHGNEKETENQNYYNMVKVLIDAKTKTQKP